MASNKQLIAEAVSLGKELGVTVSTDRMNNADLTALVDSLRAQKGGVPDMPAAPAAPAAATDSTSADVVQASDVPDLLRPMPRRVIEENAAKRVAWSKRNFKYEVAWGHSITSPRGILGEGCEVRASDYRAADIEHFLEMHAIVENA
jgi:hypothetical protein